MKKLIAVYPTTEKVYLNPTLSEITAEFYQSEAMEYGMSLELSDETAQVVLICIGEYWRKSDESRNFLIQIQRENKWREGKEHLNREEAVKIFTQVLNNNFSWVDERKWINIPPEGF